MKINPSANEQVSKLWYIHTTGCYSVTKRNEVLIHATTWMNLGNIMLNVRRYKRAHFV